MFNISFLGKREDKNAVERLTQNKGALTLNNQHYIDKSIENLSKDPSEANIKFLMNIAQCLRYGVNINLPDKNPNNDWKEKLQNATSAALEKNNSPSKSELQKEFNRIFLEKEGLNDEEKQVLDLRNKLLQTKGLPQAMQSSDNQYVKNIARNLDYFVISTEVTTKEKAECLKSLNKLMGKDYQITSQLKNKKPQVLGELLNDLVVSAKEDDMPMIKGTNQREHGMCAAISIARKAMAYEYKSKFVNQVMEELSAANTMEVYDVTKLGTGAKSKVQKADVDYDYALNKGYRILDAATLNWINIANSKGTGDIQHGYIKAFDREFFDTFHDSQYNRDLKDPALLPHQNYLRTLEKAEDELITFKNTKESREKEALEQHRNERFNAQEVARSNAIITKDIAKILPGISTEDANKVLNELLNLRKNEKSEFHIIDPEETSAKIDKIKGFLASKSESFNEVAFEENIDDLYDAYLDSIETSEYMAQDFIPKSPRDKFKQTYQPLYKIAGSYRASMLKKLDIPEVLNAELKRLNLPENAEKDAVMAKYEKDGLVVPEAILRKMQDRISKISVDDDRVENAVLQGNKSSVDKALFNLSPEEKTALDKVNKNVNKMLAEISRERQTKQKELEVPLTELAQEVGAEKGEMVWLQKEGSSGLSTPQEIRIFEQMTGEPHYEENDLDTIAKTIEKGEHSGVSNTSVYHDSIGGHAQYIAEIASLKVKNPETGKTEIKKAMMQDNTWGPAEHKRTWLDSMGLLRTDYQCGRGGDTGYITNKVWQNGTLLDDFKNKYGETQDGYKFKLFWDAVLPTKFSRTEGTTKSLVLQALIGPQQKFQAIGALQEGLNSTTFKEIKNVEKTLDTAGQVASTKIDNVIEQIKNVRTENDYNKLPDDVKLYLSKAAIVEEYPADDIYQMVSEIKTLDEFEAKKKEIKQTIVQFAKEDFASVFNPDLESPKPEEIDDIDDPVFVQVKKWIDKTYDPASNKEFVDKLDSIKKYSDRKFNMVMSKVTRKDLGLKTITPFELAKSIAAENENGLGTIENLIASEVESDYISTLKMDLAQGINPATLQSGEIIEGEIVDNEGEMNAEMQQNENPAILYYQLSKALDQLNIQKEINSIKGEYAKQGVRVAYKDDTALIQDEQIGELINNFVAQMIDAASLISTLKAMQAGKIDKQGLSDKDIAIALKNQQTEFNNARKTFIEANVAPAQRNSVAESLNKFLNSAIKNKKTAENDLNDFANKLAKNHILKNPREILNEFVRLNYENKGSENMQQIYQGYLMSAFDSLSRLEFKNNFYKAIAHADIHKFANDLSNIDVSAILVGKEGTFADDENFAILMESLVANTGAERTINFIAQTGLKEKAMNSIIQSTDIEDVWNQINEQPEALPSFADFLNEKAVVVDALDVQDNAELQKAKEEFLNRVDEALAKMDEILSAQDTEDAEELQEA